MLAIIWYVGFSPGAKADEATIAIASNFAATAKKIAREFETRSGHKLNLAFGSTGKHFAQIINGAPFDAFFAADKERPLLLEKNGSIIKNSRFTYAIGKLVLWSADNSLIVGNPKILTTSKFSHLAIANPRLAPYGVAARQVLKSLSLWVRLQNKIVRGENAGQTFQFVKSGNAMLGFVPLAYIHKSGQESSGSYWLPDQSNYDEIIQQAVLLTNNKAATDFLKFVRSNRGRQIIKASGFGVADVR